MAFDTDSRLWEYPPDWRHGFTVEYEYRTEIITSRAGREQRRAIRQSPRKTLSFTAMVSSASFRSLVRDMASAQDKSFIVPDYVRSVLTVEPLANNGSSVAVETVPAWATTGATVVIGFAGAFDTFVIDAISDNRLTFSTTAKRNWPSGSKLYPGLYARLDTTLRHRQRTSRAGELNVTFSVEPGSEPLPIPPEPSQLLNGRELFLKRPNWAQTVEVTFGTSRETLDYGYGTVIHTNPVPFNTRDEQFVFVGRSPSEAVQMLDFFDRMRGQQGEFYMPTWTEDLSATAGISPADPVLRVADARLADDYSGDTVHKAIAVVLSDGSILARKVTDIYPDPFGMGSILEIAGGWDRTVPLSNISMVCWLPVWRFASDKLTVEWLTDAVTQFAVTIRTLEDLSGE